MWPSLKTIEQPATLAEAYGLLSPPQRVLFSGGSYLAADRSPHIDTLVDIGRLVGNQITIKQDQLLMEAGATLEEIIRQLGSGKYSELAHSARWSCPSKNIRNQRTLGGEIGQARTDSELLTMLHCLGATIELESKGPSGANLRDWDGDGIVTSVRIAAADLHQAVLQRFALLPSAPAFVIVAGARRNNTVDIAIGGRANRVMNFTLPDTKQSAESISELASESAKQFTSDHHGTAAYKQQLIETGIARVVNGL